MIRLPAVRVAVALTALAATAAAQTVTLNCERADWQRWWNLHESGFLDLRQHVQSSIWSGLDCIRVVRNPLPNDICAPSLQERQTASKALQQALAACAMPGDRDLATLCLLALARIRTPPEGVWLLAHVFTPQLRNPEPEVREMAALGIGIAGAGGDGAFTTLAALAQDLPHGRELVGRDAVDVRMRAFATYGLGLLLEDAEPGAANAIADVLVALLRGEAAAVPDLCVAAVQALSLLPRRDGEDQHAAARTVALRSLQALLDERADVPAVVRAHVPTAAARLLRPSDPEAEAWRARCATLLETAAEPMLAQSGAITLGALCRPWDDAASPDAARGRLLAERCRHATDIPTRMFATMALAQIGGAAARSALLAALPGPGWFDHRSTVALALGVDAWRARAGDGKTKPDATVVTALRGAMTEPSEEFRYACALALGLCGDGASVDAMRGLLGSHNDDPVRFAALGLALLRDPTAFEWLREHFLPAGSVLRVQGIAVARALLDDKAAGEDLLRVAAAEGSKLAERYAALSALDRVGDRRALYPLLGILADGARTPIERAFAAHALGGICETSKLPWHARLAYGCNWYAAVPTLTDTGGVLDQR